MSKINKTTNNGIYVTSSNGVAQTSGLTAASTNSIAFNPAYTTYGTTLDWSDMFASSYENSLFNLMSSYLTEDRLREILDELKSKNVPADMFQNAVFEIVSERHCSEEFIMNYLDIDVSKIETTRKILYKQHKADILSGSYAQLALLLEITKEN